MTSVMTAARPATAKTKKNAVKPAKFSRKNYELKSKGMSVKQAKELIRKFAKLK